VVSRLIPRSVHGSSGLPMSGIGTPEDDSKGNLVEFFGKDLQSKMIYSTLGMRAARKKSTIIGNCQSP
jgi:hypothetical protein